MENRAINLGRCYNKYLIGDILLFAGEDNPLKEAEQLLWSLGKRHRQFLPGNRSWYSKTIKAVWASL